MFRSRLTSITRTLRTKPTRRTTCPTEPRFCSTRAELRARLAQDTRTLFDFMATNTYSVEVGTKKKQFPRPDHLRASIIPHGVDFRKTSKESGLHTVCEEAKCPNKGVCWSAGTATYMILGDTCTRACNVKTSKNPLPPDPDEPRKVAEAIVSKGWDYAVITSVDRDDLPDQGSGHIVETVQKLKALKPELLIEILAPDFRGDPGCVKKVATSGLNVFAHNIETVEELQHRVRDPRANFQQSLDVLMMAKDFAPVGTLTKTSIMLGCGETPEQVVKTMEKVRAAGVDVMTIGQYLRPSKGRMPVSEFVTPKAFEMYRILGLEMGFLYVASGPLVRSSYKAGEIYNQVVKIVDKN